MKVEIKQRVKQLMTQKRRPAWKQGQPSESGNLTRLRGLSFLAVLVWMTTLAFGLTFGLTSNTQAQSKKPVILVMGDSISAEYGLPPNTGWVKLLEARLQKERFDYSVVNASISGETTSGGLSRFPLALQQHRPAIVIIELGGNDGLRGLSLKAAENNLAQMIRAAQAQSARVLLVGIQIPPNYGKVYSDQLVGLYPKLATQYKTAVVPLFFAGFAERIDAFQADRIHPAQASQGLLLENVWPRLKPLLTAASKS